MSNNCCSNPAPTLHLSISLAWYDARLYLENSRIYYCTINVFHANAVSKSKIPRINGHIDTQQGPISTRVHLHRLYSSGSRVNTSSLKCHLISFFSSSERDVHSISQPSSRMHLFPCDLSSRVLAGHLEEISRLVAAIQCEKRGGRDQHDCRICCNKISVIFLPTSTKLL